MALMIGIIFYLGIISCFLKAFIDDEDEKVLLKDYCDKVRKKALELSAKFLIEEDIFSFKDLEARRASLDYFTDKKIKSDCVTIIALCY